MDNMAELKRTETCFGTLSNGKKVNLFTISNKKMSVSVSDYGCTLTSIVLPGDVDVLLGYSTLDGFVNDNSSYGVVVGRFANRIGGASFVLDGTSYSLDKNDGENMLHGGFDRWEKKVWEVAPVQTETGLGVRFFRQSKDGEQHFPGTMDVTVTYTLDENNVLTLDYKAICDKKTPINLTNHAYFNLKGYMGGTICDHELQMNCDSYIEVDKNLIPTKKLPVKGTAFDFTTPKTIGKDIEKTVGGYDHCFCQTDYVSDGTLRTIATVKEPVSGRTMVVKTTLPDRKSVV